MWRVASSSVGGLVTRWSQSLGASTGAFAGGAAQIVLGPAAVMLDASLLADSLEGLDASRSRTAGREAIRIRARIGGRDKGARALVRDAGSGAEDYEISVDAELGVLLGVEALRGGRAFRVVEATALRLDDRFSPELFSPPSGSEHGTARVQARRLTIGELVAAVDFTVLLPDPSPGAVAPLVALVQGDRHGPGASRAVLTYPVASDGRRGQLRLQLTAEEPPTSARDRWRVENDVIVSEEQHGDIVRRRVRTRRDGSFVELESALLGLDELVAIARSLRPVLRS